MADHDLRWPLRDKCAPAATEQGAHMSRYFFNITDGQDIHDTEGTELADIGEARDQAIVAAGEMIKHNGNTVWNGSPWMMNVVDEAGTLVFTLTFSANDHA